MAAFYTELTDQFSAVRQDQFHFESSIHTVINRQEVEVCLLQEMAQNHNLCDMPTTTDAPITDINKQRLEVNGHH